MSDLIDTPMENVKQNPSKKASGPATYNGEPGLPQRTHSPNAVDEVTYDRSGLPSGQQK